MLCPQLPLLKAGQRTLSCKHTQAPWSVSPPTSTQVQWLSSQIPSQRALHLHPHPPCPPKPVFSVPDSFVFWVPLHLAGCHPSLEVPLPHLCQAAFPDHRNSHSRPLPSPSRGPELLSKHIRWALKPGIPQSTPPLATKQLFLLAPSFLLKPSPPIPAHNPSQMTSSGPHDNPFVYSFIYFLKKQYGDCQHCPQQQGYRREQHRQGRAPPHQG